MGLLTRLRADRQSISSVNSGTSGTGSAAGFNTGSGRFTKSKSPPTENLAKPPPTHAKTHTSTFSGSSSDFSTTASDSSATSGDSHHFSVRTSERTDSPQKSANSPVNIAKASSRIAKNFQKPTSTTDFNFPGQEVKTPIKEFDRKLPHPFKSDPYRSDDSLPISAQNRPVVGGISEVFDDSIEATPSLAPPKSSLDPQKSPYRQNKPDAAPISLETTSPANDFNSPPESAISTDTPGFQSTFYSSVTPIAPAPVPEFAPYEYENTPKVDDPPVPAAINTPVISPQIAADTTNSSDYDSTSSGTTSSDDDDDAKTKSSTKPSTKEYFDQWRQYYSALAAQRQQQMQQQYMAAMSRQSMYGGFPMMQPYGYGMPMNYVQGMQGMAQMSSMQQMHPYYMHQQQQMMMQQQGQPGIGMGPGMGQAHPYMTQDATAMSQSQPDFHNNDENQPYSTQPYPKVRGAVEEEGVNELMSGTRRSTLKSNRFPSVPSFLSLANNKGTTAQLRNSSVHNRNSSLDLNFKPKKFNYEDETSANDKSKSAKTGDSSWHDLSVDADVGARYISDYNKYLFDDDEESGEKKVEEYKKEPNQLPTPNSTEESLSQRRGSTDSDASFDSIQSAASSKFVVGSGAERSERINALREKDTSKKKKSSADPKKSASPEYNGKKATSKNNRSISPEKRDAQRRELKSKGSVASFQDPRMSMMGGSQFDLYSAGGSPGSQGPPMTPTLGPMDPMMHNSPYAGSMMNFGGEFSGTPLPNNRRQSVIPDVSPPVNGNGRGGSVPPQGRFSMIPSPMAGGSVQAVKTHDPTINDKIMEFTKLRQIISSGNKSIEYRLKWVKMLMTATNFKLYAYINIKGEPIPPEQAAFNKTLFVKSSVTHLLKLLREYEGGNTKRLDVKHEVYFIYACLLKRDYLVQFNQDFGIPKNIPLAIEYFEKCLEIHPTDFKTMYKLGDIYEYEFEDQFDKALEWYKKSAKGYNRAIFQISLLYLNNPEVRSTKFFRYLEDLSSIDPRDIRLDDEDKEDLEEVIGLASYHLGRIYEGLYPGDLSAEDEFIVESLKLAPVNYAKSLTYYNKSAKLNCLLAQVKLGQVYEHGELNRPPNANKSIQWYLRAASSPLTFKRHPDAMLGLSRWNVSGSQGQSKHIPMPNPDKALMWCDRAFKEFASADAAFYMGELIEMGVSPGDPMVWFTKAHEMGHPGASVKLGIA